MNPAEESAKEEVRRFWEAQSCGEIYAEGGDLEAQLDSQSRKRYELEPYIPDFAHFEEGAGKAVLEIGVGMGADHLRWARSRPSRLCGIDLTERAIGYTRTRLEIYGFSSDLRVADAEALPFPDESFDVVYSWGVLHHSPDTQGAISEVYRVLRPAGTARIMVYHRYSLIGLMLWMRYGLAHGRPWMSLSELYGKDLESPGTKAYSIAEATVLFRQFSLVQFRTQLSVGDLLEGCVGQRHDGLALRLAKSVWPRWIVRRYLQGWGLNLLIEVTK